MLLKTQATWGAVRETKPLTTDQAAHLTRFVDLETRGEL